MPQLRFAISSGGLIVPLVVGLSGYEMRLRQAAGQQLPPPLHASDVLDTGTDISAVSAPLASLAIVSTMRGRTNTAAGPLQVRVFEVSIRIIDPNQSSAAWLTVPDLLVMELLAALPDADVLIGLDILLTCKLTLDGPARSFTLDF